jgi:hypothetical protein
MLGKQSTTELHPAPICSQGYKSLNSGPHACSALPLEPHPSPPTIFALLIFQVEFHVSAWGWSGLQFSYLWPHRGVATPTGAHHTTGLLINMGSS